MRLLEISIDVPISIGEPDLLTRLSSEVSDGLAPDQTPIRFAVTASDDKHVQCEIGVAEGDGLGDAESIFRFDRRLVESAESFNAVMLVPTGIGSEIGGHAGDAMPAATLLAAACDTLITHPNVVNASDVIEITPNTLYVEGSVISRMLMGTIGLQKVRVNRLLVVIDAHKDSYFVDAAINSVSAARASYGLPDARVAVLDPPIRMEARYAGSGRAAGIVENLDSLWNVLDEESGSYDAVAISSLISVPYNYHQDYFDRAGEMVNPWGGVEAMLTHAISQRLNVPSAHSPMLESREVANLSVGIVDPRMAAEAVSLTFLQCILKGLQRSPRIITDSSAMNHHSVLTASDVSCLVIPDKCIGLPTLAALEQGIPVIAVKESTNVMQNDLEQLPWADGQLHIVENYWEAAGVMTAMRAGIDPKSVRRPLAPTIVERVGSDVAVDTVKQTKLPTTW